MTKTAAVGYEVRWRKDTDPANQWSSPVGVGADGHVKVPGLERVTDYTLEARAISGCGAKSAWATQTLNLPDVPTGTLTLDGLKTEVDDAAADASAATTELQAWSSDGVLSPTEKPAFEHLYAGIINEQAGIDTQANAFSITTEKSDYDNAISTLTAYLNALTTPVAWDNKSGTTTITASTFLGYFNAVYTKRQTLLNAIYAAAKALANTAQTTANTALDQLGNLSNSQYLQNPFFATGDLTGWTSDHHSVYFESGTNGPASGSTSYAVFPHGTASEALRNAGKIPVYPGAVIKAQCAVRGTGSPNGVCGVRISWRGADDLEIASTMTPNPSTGNATNGTYVTGTAPAGAMFAHVECATSGRTDTGGYYSVDNFAAWALADTLDQVPDGSTYARTSAGALTGGNVDLSKAGVVNKNLGNVADGGGRYGVHAVDGNNLALVDFSQAGHVNKNLDNIGNGTTYARPLATQLQNGILRAVNSGRNLVTNGGFELNASNSQCGDGWDGGGGLFGIVRANAGAASHSGAYVLQINAAPGTVIPTGQTFGAVNHFNIDVGIGDTLYLGAWFQSFCNASFPANITGTLAVQIVFRDSTGATIDSQAVYANLTIGGWQQVTTTKMVPVGTVSAYMQVLAFTTNNSGSAYTIPAGQFPFIVYVDDLFCYALTNLDTDAQDGTTYGRTANADLYVSGGVNRVGLRVPGSGHTIGDQRNLQPITWASQRSVLSNSPISYSISGTTVTFSVAAVTLMGGGISLNYGASSGSVTQSAGTTTTWFLYYRDAAQGGGSLPLNITTNPGGAASWPDSIFLGTAQVTVNSGGGGTGGTGGGGGGYCVADDMFIGEDRRAGDAEIGDPFDCIDLPTAAGKHVRALQGVTRGVEECVRMITDDGCALVCSVSTPFDLPDGRNTTAPHMLGEQVITDLGVATVISLALVGPRPVTRAHLGGVSYAAGADPRRRIYSHNAGSISKP